MSKTQEALKLALEALAASDDFLFNYHDCEPNNEREVDAYSEVRANNMKAWEAIREALAEQPAIPLGDSNTGLQWDKTSQAFNDWWDSDYDPTGNPFRQDSAAYWAWAGWKAATEQPAQPYTDVSGAWTDYDVWFQSVH